MTTAIVYYSTHHGNTKRILDAIAAADHEVSLINVTEKVDTIKNLFFRGQNPDDIWKALQAL